MEWRRLCERLSRQMQRKEKEEIFDRIQINQDLNDDTYGEEDLSQYDEDSAFGLSSEHGDFDNYWNQEGVFESESNMYE